MALRTLRKYWEKHRPMSKRDLGKIASPLDKMMEGDDVEKVKHPYGVYTNQVYIYLCFGSIYELFSDINK